MQNYHNHKSYSNAFTPFKDSHVSYLDYARRAKTLGHRVLTCMEHGYQGNFLKLWSLVQTKAFLKEFGDYPFKLVFGAEAYWVVDRREPDDTNAHICLFARNESGRRQLTEILSIANEDGFYRVPRVDLELLHRLNPRDVLVTTACVSFWGKIPRETGQLVWTEGIDSIFRELHAHFGSSLYLEVQAHDTQWQRDVNLHALQLSRERGVPLIVGLDSHYVSPEQEQERIWLREESGVKLDEDRGRDGIFEDYPDDETIRQRFARQGVLTPAQVEEAMRSTDVFLTFEDLHFGKEKKLPTIYPELSQQQRNQKYLDLVWQSWESYRLDIPKADWPRYKAAIHEETDVVTSTDMSDYFLIDYELVKRAKELGGVITPTGRGSGGSFFTNTLLGFSTLDRLSLPVTLYPSRFISKERLMAGSLPDLDLNVGNPEIFAQAQEEIMGKGHAYPMIAYGTLKLKSAFRLFARAMGLPMATQNIVSEQLEEYETELKNAGDDEEIDVYDFVDESYREYVEGARAYLGIVVSKSQAPCGYLIYNGDIRSEIGLIRVVSKTTKKSVLCTVIDGYTADEFGYVKNDLLKVDVVQVNYTAMKEAELAVLTSKQIIELTRNDPATWDLLAKGYTVGINQCERAATRQKLMQYRPQNLTELSAFVAAIRPSFKSKVMAFLDRQHFDYGIGALDALLQTPEMDSSWILYQEQIMGVLGYAGFPMDQAYSIIKAIGKKHPEVVKPLRERFDEGFALRMAEDEHVPLEEARKRAEEVWQIIDDATSYGFNASHAVAVSLDALYGAYLKAHYPLQYYKTLLSICAEKKQKDRIAAIKAEMLAAFGIRLTHCRFGEDNREFAFHVQENTITDALQSIKGISKGCAVKLHAAAQVPHACWVDFLLYNMQNGCAKADQLRTLVKLSYFEAFGGAKKLLRLFDEMESGENRIYKGLSEKSTILRREKLIQLEAELADEDFSELEKAAFEREFMGAPVSCFDVPGNYAMALEVNQKYSPRITLYNLRKGTTGIMKVKKDLYWMNPITDGQVIVVDDWMRRPRYRYAPSDAAKRSKPKPIPGQFDLWLTGYRHYSEKMFEEVSTCAV